jgi:hypothetical protein
VFCWVKTNGLIGVLLGQNKWFNWGSVAPGELGPAEEFMARIDIEVDSPGPSHVIRSVPLQARVGTARVHAPKDLQVALYFTSHCCLSGTWSVITASH